MKKLTDWHFFLKILFSAVIAVSAACTLDAQIVPYTSDANTILLDHFDGSTSATISAFNMDGSPNGTAYPSATPSYSYGLGPNGLNQALILYPPSGMPAGSGTYLNYPGGQLLSQAEGTIEFWLYIPAYGSTVITLLEQVPYTNAAAGYTFQMFLSATGQITASAWAAFSMNSGTTLVPLNTWTHVAVTWGSSGAKLYINGVLVGSDTNTGMPASGYGGSVLVYLGTQGISSAGIDELRISDKARLPQEFNLQSLNPTIASFTPAAGPIGTSVTIAGTNFNTTVANNIVWFGAVQATVTAATSTSLSVIVPIGTNYQPITVTDITTGLTAYSNAPFIVTFPSWQIIDATAFAPAIDFPTGSTPNNVLVGDIDGDGKPDVVVANYNSNTISIYRNTSTSGSIGASSFDDKVDFPTGAGPIGIAIGDIDGDGKPDLVVTNWTSNTISVFRNTSTPGSITTSSFATNVDFPTGTNPSDVVIGDIDGDGKPDLAVTNKNDNTISVFRNTSASGSITASSFASGVVFTTGTYPAYIAIGDIDGDGKLDLAVANNNSSGTVSVFRNTSTSGSITTSSFAASVDFTTGSYPYGVAIGDIDGDGKPELIVTNPGSNTVSIYRNTSTSGSITAGSFDAPVDFTTGTSPYCIVLGDIDGDGKPDLAVTNYSDNTVSVFRNTSTSGSITVGTLATKVDFTIGTNPWGISISDLDGDGKPDLVIADASSNTISVLRNTLAASLPPVITSFTPTSGPSGTTVTFTGTNFNTTASSNIVWFGAVQATVTTATSTSLSVTVPIGTDYQPITVTDVTTGLTAYSNVPFIVTFPSSQVIDATAFATSVDFTTEPNPEYVALSDIDGDGKLDLVVTNGSSNTVSVYRNKSTSGSITADSFDTPVDFTTGIGPVNVSIGDIDGDGKPDLVVANFTSNTISVFRNTSSSGSITTGSFAVRVDFTTGTNPVSIGLGDIDGDGKPDLVVTNSGSNSVSVFRNTCIAGSITTGSFAARVDFTTGATPQTVAIGDIDGDGKPDLAVTNYSDNTVSVYRNTSTPGSITTSSFATNVDFNTGSGPYSVVIGDIDGDGKQDLVVTNSDSNTLSVYRNISTSGSITSGSFATNIDFTTGTSPQGIAIGDIDGDGKPDLAVTNFSDNTVSVLRNTSTSGSITAGSFANKVDFATGSASWCVAIDDIDGDGKPDLAIANRSSNTISVLRNTILTTTLPPVITSFTPTSGPSGTTVTITGTNFNTTAASNIVWFGAVQATVTAATSTSLSVTVPIGTNFQPITVTDITTGLTAYSNAPFIVTFPSSQVIDATAFASTVDFTTGTEPNNVAIGDIDGDGKPDLVVTNYESNTVSVYRNISASGSIGASSFADKVDFPTGGGPIGIAISDIDGDGKPDLVVTNELSNTISVYRNTSASGSITTGSFTASVNFGTELFPYSVAIGDVDGDGKPDLVVANYGNTISIFRNTSTSGSITTGSFAAKVDFTTGSGPVSVAIGDIDGDGKPDLVTANYSSNTISVFRNTCTSGSITSGSFATNVDFTTGSDPYSVAIGDIDGDGKPDLVVANSGSNTVSVFRNISTSGSITAGSFDTPVDFTTGSDPTYLAIGDIDGDGKPDLAVTNYRSNSVSIFRNTSTSGSIGTSSFSVNVDFTTGTNPYGVAIGDIDGDGKPDLVVANYS